MLSKKFSLVASASALFFFTFQIEQVYQYAMFNEPLLIRNWPATSVISPMVTIIFYMKKASIDKEAGGPVNLENSLQLNPFIDVKDSFTTHSTVVVGFPRYNRTGMTQVQVATTQCGNAGWCFAAVQAQSWFQTAESV